MNVEHMLMLIQSVNEFVKYGCFSYLEKCHFSFIVGLKVVKTLAMSFHIDWLSYIFYHSEKPYPLILKACSVHLM